MTSKKEIIDFINTTNKTSLTNINTSYSKINKSKAVWWFNIRKDKFKNDVHLLLKSNNTIIWIVLPKGFNLTPFKIREDKNAVDLEISSDRNFKFLHDIKSGGSGFDFSSYVKKSIAF